MEQHKQDTPHHLDDDKGHEEQSSVENDNQEAPAITSVTGDSLRQERIQQGYSLKDASSVINIRVGQLEAIESGDLNELPGMVYAIGFLRTYAEFLGLDSEEIVKRFKAEHAESSKKPGLSYSTPPPQQITETQMPDIRILVSAGVGIFVIFALWAFLSRDTDVAQISITDIPEVPVEMVVADVEDKAVEIIESMSIEKIDTQIEETAVTTQPQETNKQEQARLRQERLRKQQQAMIYARKKVSSETVLQTGKSRVIIRAHQPSWIHIQDRNKKTIFKKVLRPGLQYSVPNMPNLTMITANAGVLDIYVDGKKVPPIGRVGDIMRGVSLEPKSLTRKRVTVRR